MINMENFSERGFHQILTLKFWFNKFCYITIHIFAQDYQQYNNIYWISAAIRRIAVLIFILENLDFRKLNH